MVIHFPHLALRCTANIQYQASDALYVLKRLLGVYTALKTVSGIGGKIESSGAARDGFGPPKSCFDVNVLGVVRNRCGVTTHDAGQGLHLRGISNDAHFLVKSYRAAIQQLEGFARFCPANHQTLGDFVEIENMRGPTQLKHHIVGNIHQSTHASLATTR